MRLVNIRYTNNGGQLTYSINIAGISNATPEMNIQGNTTSIVDGDATPQLLIGLITILHLLVLG